LSFSFPAPAATETIAAGPGASIGGNGPAPFAEQKESPFRSRRREDDWSMAAPNTGGEETFPMKSDQPFAELDRPIERSFEFGNEWPLVAKQDETPREAAARSSPNRPVSITPYLLLCGALLFVFSGFTLVYKARPAAIETLLRIIPWVGSSVLKNDHLRQGIVLEAARPRFQRILGNREVFLLSGVALNRNRVKVREIKIAGYAFGSDGNVLESHVITVGNAISSKIVRDLTDQEIKTLQKQGPVKRFEISPNEAAPFSIVFMKSSAEIKSFAYRVLSADEG
jgi:hypothetical protein